MRFFIYILTLFFLPTPAAVAQLYFSRYDSVPVSEENGPLRFPWAGGINHPQFSNIDFNSDGRNDLLVFDKTGDKLLCFTTNAQNELELAPQYREMFTNQHGTSNRQLHGWVLLRDFNGDGKNDIFTYSNGGLAIYRNDANADSLIFTLMTPKLLSDYGSGPINIYVSPSDLPAIMDVDGDGDMDLVTFSLFGSSAEYHQNQSVELYGIPDSLVFEQATPCWGNFAEDPSTLGVDLDVSCKGGTHIPLPTNNTANAAAHSGFTLLGLDIEGDGDQDLVVSIINFDKMNILINDGDATTAHIGSQDLSFPANFSNTDAIDIYTFPAAFLADVNNDGKDDIIAAPYQENNGHNYQSSHLYLNSAMQGFELNFSKNNFLQDEMIELGTSAYPVLFDVDQDGLKDLLVGGKGYFISTGNYSSQLAYYRNTGTATNPAFTLQTRDFANISSLNLGNVAPTFGDIDGDGDEDMIVGAVDGQVHYFENSAGPGNPAVFALTTPGFQGININEQFATPQLFDVDRDGLLDLIIGGKGGKLHYYRNEGTETAPMFVATDSNFGSVNVTSLGSANGYSAPYMFEHQGQLQLLVGSESGNIELYNEIDDVISNPDELTADIGSGTTFSSGPETTPFGFSTQSGRTQYLIRASELTAAGLSQGAIEQMTVITENTSTSPFGTFYIRMGQTLESELTGFVDNLTTVHYQQAQTVPQDTVSYDFTAQSYGPLTWDGESNLVIEVCWYRGPGSSGNDQNVLVSTLPYACTAYGSSTEYDGCTVEFMNTTMQRPNFTFAIKPSFNKIARFPIYEGERSAPCIGDLDEDGLPELIIGNMAGGLAYYKGDTTGLTISSVANYAIKPVNMQLYPNPNSGTFTLQPNRTLQGDVELIIYDVLGKVVWNERVTNLSQQTIDVSVLKNGLYFLQLRAANQTATQRFIIQK